MKRISISKAISKAGKVCNFQGWIQVIRDHGRIMFILLRDSTGILQCVISDKFLETFDDKDRLSVESVVSVVGIIEKTTQTESGVELKVSSLDILSVADPRLPILVVDKGENETDQSIRLDHRWIDLRKPEKLLEFRVSSLIENTFRDYMLKNGFILIHTPKLMGAASESGSDVFEVKYFDKKAYLAQSPQFYKQMAMAAGFERVFEIGPVFRAEPSFTSRHLTEFTGLDFEMSFIKSQQDVMDVTEDILKEIMKLVMDEFGYEITKYYGRAIPFFSDKFPQVTMKEAKTYLKKFNIESEKEGDLNGTEELKLCEIIKNETGSELVFITEYPKQDRAFYHMRNESDGNCTKGFDLLWNGTEICTGAQREHRYERLLAQVKDKGLNPDSLVDYLNFFKYGCPPHGGCGLGLERILMKTLGLNNIREASFLPRTVQRLTP